MARYKRIYDNGFLRVLVHQTLFELLDNELLTSSLRDVIAQEIAEFRNRKKKDPTSRYQPNQWQIKLPEYIVTFRIEVFDSSYKGKSFRRRVVIRPPIPSGP